MSLYQLLLVVKFLGVMGYAGGAIAGWIASDPADRRRAVHAIASPSLLLTWCSGYSLLALSGLPMFELWPVGGLVLSLVSNAALVLTVAREWRTPSALAWTAIPLVLVVALMVVKPSWHQVVQ